MKPVERSELLGLGEYEQIRSRFRERVIAEKKRRRVFVGEHMSAVFENHDSAMFQIQEMLRTERITSEPAILHELATYNELVPGEDQLSMTLMIEIPDKELREKTLEAWAGLEKTVGVEVDGTFFKVHGRFAGVIEGRTTAVHYFKIDLDSGAASAIRSKKAKVAIVVKHEKAAARAELSAETVAALAEDLAS